MNAEYQLHEFSTEFNKLPKKFKTDKAIAIAQALIDLEDERIFGHDKPAGIISCTKNTYLIFGTTQE